MASQTDVQQLIQGLSQGSNNGNPNTIYNNAPGLPMADANGNWYLQNLPTAASINLQRGEAGGGVPNLFASLPPLGTTGIGGVNPAWPINPTAPVVAPVTGGGGGTGGVPGAASGTTIPNAVSVGGNGGGNQSLPGNLLQNLPPVSSFQNGGATTGGDPLAGWSNGISLPEFLQGAQGVGGTLMEVLDKLSEPWLKGDFVRQGNFNWRAVLDAAAKRYGIPTGTLASLMGKGAEYKAWLSEGYGVQEGDLRFGDLSSGNSEGYGIGQVNPITGQLSLGLLNGISFPQGYTPSGFNDHNANMAAVFGPNWNAPVAPAATAGTIAGAGVLTGDAARGMFEGMKMASLLKGNMQSGGDIYGNKYEK